MPPISVHLCSSLSSPEARCLHMQEREACINRSLLLITTRSIHNNYFYWAVGRLWSQTRVRFYKLAVKMAANEGNEEQSESQLGNASNMINAALGNSFE